MSFFSFFKSSLAQPANPQTIQGGNVLVNVSPTDERTIKRHKRRIFLCKKASKIAKDKNRLASLQAEINRREHLLQAAGVELDDDET